MRIEVAFLQHACVSRELIQAMDFFTLCFSEANIIQTVLMLVVICYWLLMMVGVVGVDMFDIDVDVDAHLGMDADLDFGVDVDANGDLASAGGSTTTGNDSFLKGVFEFFYLSDIPLMIVGSTFMLCFWTSTLITSQIFNEHLTFGISMMWLIPNIIVGLIGMRILVLPLAILFRKRSVQDKTREDMIGMIGRVTSSVVNQKFGEIQVNRPGEPEMILNVRTLDGEELGQGDAAKIISYNYENGTFVVELTKWENNTDG